MTAPCSGPPCRSPLRAAGSDGLRGVDACARAAGRAFSACPRLSKAASAPVRPAEPASRPHGHAAACRYRMGAALAAACCQPGATFCPLAGRSGACLRRRKDTAPAAPRGPAAPLAFPRAGDSLSGPQVGGAPAWRQRRSLLVLLPLLLLVFHLHPNLAPAAAPGATHNSPLMNGAAGGSQAVAAGPPAAACAVLAPLAVGAGYKLAGHAITTRRRVDHLSLHYPRGRGACMRPAAGASQRFFAS